MKKAGVILTIISLLGLAACTSAKANGSGTVDQISTWVRLKAALSARFTSGQSALQAANDAKAAAKSYKMRVEMRLHPGDPFITEEDISCPDHLHMFASLGDRPMYEAYRIGATSYVKDEQDKWVQSPVPPEVYPCGNNPGASAPWAILNEGRDMSSALAQLAKRAKARVSVGELAMVEGTTCQNWLIEFGHPGSKSGGHSGDAMHYTMCIDIDTHLPVQVVMGSGGIILKYYGWNQPMNITSPM